MEPAVRLTAAPPPLPVARLQGDVLAEYLRFLELDEEAAPATRPTRVPVAWLQGEVRDEFLRFLEEAAAGGAAAIPACPELQEDDEEYKSAPNGRDDDGVGFDGLGHGVVVDDDDDYESFVDDVLAEYLRFLELDEDAAPAPEPRPRPARVPVAWLQGEVRDEFLRFLEESAGGAAAVACPEEDEEEHGRAPHGSDDDDVGFDGRGDGVVAEDDDDVCVMEYRSEDGGVVFTMDTEEELDDDPALELLRPHILDLPAFRARAAAAAAGVVRQQFPRTSFPRQGGWMSSNDDDDDEMTDDDDESFPRQDGRMRSELLRRCIGDLEAKYRACATAAEAVQQQLSLAFPRHQDGWMSSDNDDEMTDELPRQDDGWMASDDADDDERTDEFTGNRNRVQLRHTY